MRGAYWDSDASSWAESSPSPARSPNPPPLYYVESPSRDSHDGDRSSARATPEYNSPTESPSYLAFSRSSSASRVSGPCHSPAAAPARRARGERFVHGYSAIEEERFMNGCGEEGDDGPSGMWKVLLFLSAVAAICVVGGFALWRSLSVNYFHVGIGQDLTGVPTKMVDVNCSVEMSVFNPASHFGLHVSSTNAMLFYSQLAIASDQLEEFYLPREAHEAKSLILKGEQVPLYGAGLGFDIPTTGVISAPVTLKVDLLTRGNLFGPILKVKFEIRISCKLAVDSGNNKPIGLSERTCTYYDSVG
ncbi:hypothetical protein AXF42_Ash004927 [Apostasia shenzhenica]|uniref:Late embryogenesis abundant protein LEA-2 subgroup domain-containing protein n=1 Tax=Apostasia shenzhenica TaxID=1088818 RepID=A0A2I0B7Z2_9ASPA|nr:hypothetical protein AXF42_Ash004927 [Apostasia shenzhenica]